MKPKAETIRNPQTEFRRADCPACGTAATRDGAKFCRVCGKLLTEEYQPLDAFRASYKRRENLLPFSESEKAELPKTENLFDENKNSASATATAFVIYSLVPFLGILFCPGALLMGGFGVFNAYRQPFLGGGRASLYSIVLSIIIFAVQILLWSLFYIIPESNRN